MLPKMVKVALHDDDGDVETLWATPLGNEHYRLENSPFFVYGVSFLDEVKAPLAEGLPTFEKVVAKSGHRTVRILMPDTTAREAKPHLEGLIELGCSYEGVQPKLLSVDVPPGVSLEAVARFLVEAALQWEYADPTYEDLFPEPSPDEGR